MAEAFALDLPPFSTCVWCGAVVAVATVVLLLWIRHTERHAAAYERFFNRYLRIGSSNPAKEEPVPVAA